MSIITPRGAISLPRGTGRVLTYDAIGNPLLYRGRSLTWTQGRRLAGITAEGLNVTYTYDESGTRTGKTVNGVSTQYYINGSQILAQKSGEDILYFLYDETGSAVGFKYNNNLYLYRKNLQGDILAVLNGQTGAVEASYTYDAWGRVISSTGALAEINPFRYRGYYYDSETGLYYISSRYYDPEVGRWINPEPNMYSGGFDEGAGVLAYNVYAYCANNPVIYKDDTGESILLCILIGAGIGLIVGGAFGAHKASENGYSPSDGWKYWRYVVGFGVVGGAIGALVGWGAGTLIAHYGVATAATSITKGGGARFSSFSALKNSLGSAGRNYQWHHIVEQCQIQKSGFSKYWIQNSNNVINIPTQIHNKISAYYSSKIPGVTGGKTVREWLAGQSFQKQYEYGVRILRMYGVEI